MIALSRQVEWSAFDEMGFGEEREVAGRSRREHRRGDGDRQLLDEMGLFIKARDEVQLNTIRTLTFPLPFTRTALSI